MFIKTALCTTLTDYFIRERETAICEHPPPHPNPLPPQIVGKT